MAKVIFDDALKGAYSDISVGQQSEETVDYKQVTTLGVESLVAAVFGILGFFWTPFILASLLGLTLGFLAHRKIMSRCQTTAIFRTATHREPKEQAAHKQARQATNPKTRPWPRWRSRS